MAKQTRSKAVISAECPQDVRDRLDERAQVEGRSRSEVIVRACLFYLAYAEVEKANQIPKPREGFLDVGGG